MKELSIEQIFFSTLPPTKQWQIGSISQILKTNLEEMLSKEPFNWDRYINQVLASYRVTPNLATVEMPFFLVYGRDPNLPLHQLLESMQQFLGDPDSRMLNLEGHRLTLVIAKKTLDENYFKTTQKTMDRGPPSSR